MKSFRWIAASAVLALCALAACGGGSGPIFPATTAAPSPTGTSNANTASVDFLFIVPTATTTARRRPSLVLPSNAQSVSLTLTSVNGTAPTTASSTTASLASGQAGCEQTSAQLSCSVAINAPAGSLVYAIKVYATANATGTPIAEANAAVTTTAGATTTQPTTLGGTVSSVAISVGGNVVPEGIATIVPITIEGLDANGELVIGTYSTPITLSLTDASGQTTLSATSFVDSTSAAGATLSYAGGVMSAPASITAASGSATASASFSPNITAPTVNGETITYLTSSAGDYEVNTPPVIVGAPAPQNPYTITTTTGASFGSATNLVAVSPPFGSPSYYLWKTSPTSAAYQYVASGNGGCSAPYPTITVVPLPSPGSGWDEYAGTGDCAYGTASNTTDIHNDGSYVVTQNGTTVAAVHSDGSAFAIENYNTPPDAWNLSAPGNAATVAAAYAVSAGPTIAPSQTPAPTATTIPNLVAAGNPATSWMMNPPSGAPSKLLSDVFTVKGSVAVPAACQGAGSVLTGLSSVTEVDEAYEAYDPAGFYGNLLSEESVQHYYVDGIGDACDLMTLEYVSYDNNPFSFISGSDTSYDTSEYITYTYVTSTSITAAAARRAMSSQRSMPQFLGMLADANERAIRAKARAAFLSRVARHTGSRRGVR